MEGVIKIKEKLRCVCFGAVVLNDKKNPFRGKNRPATSTPHMHNKIQQEKIISL
jgi:hypothetical protein